MKNNFPVKDYTILYQAVVKKINFKIKINMEKDLKDSSQRFYKELGLTYDHSSIKKVERIIEEYRNEDIFKVLLFDLAVYLGDCLNSSFEGYWTESDDVILFDEIKVDPFQLIWDFANDGEEDSLEKKYVELGISYTNSKNSKEGNLAKEGSEIVEAFLESVGLGHFKVITSAEQIDNLYLLKSEIFQLLASLEAIDTNLKEYDEYKNISRLEVGSNEMKEEIEKLKTKVAKNGDPSQMTYLGLKYQKGVDSFEKDIQQAIFWLTAAAEKGNTDAMCISGNIYSVGKSKEPNIEPNDELAEYWYLKAAEAGNAYAMFGLGLFYFRRRGISDYEKGKFWMINSINNGCDLAKELILKYSKQNN